MRFPSLSSRPALPSLKVLWHFVERDIRDSFLGWLLIAGASILLLFLRGRIQHALTVLAFMPFLLFSIFYFARVWNNQETGMSREYLLSLPISRRRLYLLQWGRVSFGLAPSFAFLFLKLDRVQSYFHIQDLSGAAYLVAGLALAAPGLVTVMSSMDSTWKLSSRNGRLFNLVRYFAGMAVLYFAAMGWAASFSARVSTYHAAELRVAYLLYFLICLRWTYLRWIWGGHAPVLKRLMPGVAF